MRQLFIGFVSACATTAAFAASSSGVTSVEPTAEPEQVCTAHHCPPLEVRGEEARRCAAVGGDYRLGPVDWIPDPNKRDANIALYGWNCFEIPEEKGLDWIDCVTGPTVPEVLSRDAGRPDKTFEALDWNYVYEIERTHGKLACDHLVPRGNKVGSGVSRGYVDKTAEVLRGEIAELEKRITELEAMKATIAALELRTAANEAAIAHINAQIAAMNATLDTLNERVRALEGRMTGVEGRLNVLEPVVVRRPYPVFRVNAGVMVLGQNPYRMGESDLLRGGFGIGPALEMAGGAVVGHGRLEATGVVMYARLSERVGSAADGTIGRGANYIALGPEFLGWIGANKTVGVGAHVEGVFHGSAAVPALGNGVEAWGGSLGPTLAVRATDEEDTVHLEARIRALVGFETAGAIINGDADVHGGAVGGLVAGLGAVF